MVALVLGRQDDAVALRLPFGDRLQGVQEEIQGDLGQFFLDRQNGGKRGSVSFR